jgi:hypothetical protein
VSEQKNEQPPLGTASFCFAFLPFARWRRDAVIIFYFLALKMSSMLNTALLLSVLVVKADALEHENK